MAMVVVIIVLSAGLVLLGILLLKAHIKLLSLKSRYEFAEDERALERRGLLERVPPAVYV